MAKKDWTAELTTALNEFVEEERELANKIIKSVADETATMLHHISPKAPGGGEYAAGWTVKNEKAGYRRQDFVCTVHNPDHYRLTHLLEKGHQSYNQFGGPYRRVRAIKHIKKAEVWGTERLLERLKAKL